MIVLGVQIQNKPTIIGNFIILENDDYILSENNNSIIIE